MLADLAGKLQEQLSEATAL